MNVASEQEINPSERLSRAGIKGGKRQRQSKKPGEFWCADTNLQPSMALSTSEIHNLLGKATEKR